MSSIQEISSNKCFNGLQKVFSHQSVETKCKMTFGVYLPPSAVKGEAKSLPVLYWLSGLTCTEVNFIQKSGFQRYASENDVIVVNPDTSPRGMNIEGEEENWDFGTGASFYVDATEDKWKNNYRMQSYVVNELPALIKKEFPIASGKQGIFGHSMGGHGALICALRNPGVYSSLSAFSPISNPSKCPWGHKAFSGYLGPNKSTWAAYDATDLACQYGGPVLDVLIDQGSIDNFLIENQLLPGNLVEAASRNEKIKINLRNQEGYDHSFFFISTFMGDHFKHHMKSLKN